jgi:metal-responsive CopG/Arc/MetJ family transcriptional regulator
MDDARRPADRLSLRLPARLAVALDAAARDEDRTRSEYVRELLRRELRGRPTREQAA